MNNHLRYPIGKFVPPTTLSLSEIKDHIQVIKAFPAQLKHEVNGQFSLDKPYRPGGWTVRQVIHHCADSHMNCFIRFKLALTEDNPTIKPYLEHLWAQSSDYLDMDVSHSLQILEGLHARWAKLLESLSEEQLNRTFHHPESKNDMSLKLAIALYAWHCQHHLGHVKLVSKG